MDTLIALSMARGASFEVCQLAYLTSARWYILRRCRRARVGIEVGGVARPVEVDRLGHQLAIVALAVLAEDLDREVEVGLDPSGRLRERPQGAIRDLRLLVERAPRCADRRAQVADSQVR